MKRPSWRASIAFHNICDEKKGKGAELTKDCRGARPGVRGSTANTVFSLASEDSPDCPCVPDSIYHPHEQSASGESSGANHNTVFTSEPRTPRTSPAAVLCQFCASQKSARASFLLFFFMHKIVLPFASTPQLRQPVLVPRRDVFCSSCSKRRTQRAYIFNYSHSLNALTHRKEELWETQTQSSVSLYTTRGKKTESPSLRRDLFVFVFLFVYRAATFCCFPARNTAHRAPKRRRQDVLDIPERHRTPVFFRKTNDARFSQLSR